jgi:V/A-type H+-transporting ATPase subunit E
MSKLEDILRDEVAAEIEAVTREAEERATSILAEAKARTEALRAARLRALEAEAMAARHRAESAAELLVNQARLQARGQVMEEVRQRALKALQDLRAQPNYSEVLQRLAEEALKGVTKAEAVVVHPEDRGYLEAWVKERGLELRTDPRISLGVRVMAAGGRIQVQNTLTERLERAWEALSATVAREIWGEG